MRKLTRILVRRFWGACAFLLISLAVFVVIGRGVSPKLDRFKDQLADYLGDQLSADLQITTMVFDWSGLSPELGLQGVKVLNADGKVVMGMETAQLKLNLIRSIINRNLALDKIVATDVSLDLSQNESGVWNFTGLPWTTTSDENISIDDPLDIFFLIGDVEFSEVQFDLTFRSGEKNSLNVPNLTFENSRDFHRLNSSIVVGDRREAVSLILEFRGDPRNQLEFTAKGYANLFDVDVEKVVSALPGNWQTEELLWKKRSMTAETWFDIFSGGEILFRGRLDVMESKQNGSSNTPSKDEISQIEIPNAIGANFTGRMTSKGFWSVSIRDAVLNWKDFQAPILNFEISSQDQIDSSKKNLTSAPVTFRSTDIDVSLWTSTLLKLGVMPQKGSDMLSELNPHGMLKNIHTVFTFPTSVDAKPQWSFSANIENFGVGSWHGAPKIENLNSFVSFQGPSNNIYSGEFAFDSEEPALIHFPTLYDKPMTFNSANGRVNWQIDTEQKTVAVDSGLLAVDTDEGSARGYFHLSIPLAEEPGHEELILQIGLRDSLVRHYKKYIPSRLPVELWDWLDNSLSDAEFSSKGEVSAGGFVYRGGMTAQGRKNSAVQLFLDVEDSSIRYHPDWPVLSNANGRLWVDQLAIHAEVSSGKFLNGQVEKLDIDIDNDIDTKEMILTLAGQYSGDAKDGLDLLRSDVMKPAIKGNLDDWTMSGPISADVNLVIPLRSTLVSPRQDISVDLQNVELSMQNIRANFSQIKGGIHYSDDLAIQAKGLTAEFLQGDINVDLSKDLQKNQLVININGANDIDRLLHWSQLDVLKFISGESAFNVNISIPYDENSGSAQLAIDSNLLGSDIDLPTPWGKSAKLASALSVTGPIGKQNNYYRVNYNDALYGVFHLDSQGLRRGVLSTEKNPNLPEKNQLLFRGTMQELDFEAWQKTYLKYFTSVEKTNSESAPLSLPLAFNLGVDQFTFGTFGVDNVALNASIVNGEAIININADKIAGNLLVYSDPTTPMSVKLDHLRLPAIEKKPPTWSDIFFPPTKPSDALEKIDPSTVPAFDFFAKQVFLGENSLGAWSFQARPAGPGLAVSDLQVVFENGRVSGRQEDEGAAMHWTKTGNGTETWVQGKFISSNLADVMEQLGQPKVLQSEDAVFDFTLRWPGAPTSVSANGLDGEIALLLQQGSFYRSGEDSSGTAALQLVSILNFDTWIRRLRLDFSDLGRGGTTFNRAEGLLEFKDGRVSLNKALVMETQSGKFQLTGVVDLENNELDTRLTATLPMGGNLTFLTALAAGLPAAVGVWVVSKIFDEQIDKVSTLNYKMNGTLQEPNVEFDSLFDSKATVSADP